MASAVFAGSFGSGGGGFLLVLTEQNLQPLVHWSPSICQEKPLNQVPVKQLLLLNQQLNALSYKQQTKQKDIQSAATIKT